MLDGQTVFLANIPEPARPDRQPVYDRARGRVVEGETPAGVRSTSSYDDAARK
jgi:hypothetical protein